MILKQTIRIYKTFLNKEKEKKDQEKKDQEKEDEAALSKISV